MLREYRHIQQYEKEKVKQIGLDICAMDSIAKSEIGVLPIESMKQK